MPKPHPWTTDVAGRHARLRLGVAQIETELGDLHTNMARHVEASRGAESPRRDVDAGSSVTVSLPVTESEKPHRSVAVPRRSAMRTLAGPRYRRRGATRRVEAHIRG